MKKLKPCPFCGSENINVRTAMGETWAFCHGCGVSTNMCISEENAVFAWNMRTGQNVIIEKLKIILDEYNEYITPERAKYALTKITGIVVDHGIYVKKEAL